MNDSILNLNYPSMHAITSSIVQTAAADLIKMGYAHGGVADLPAVVEATFNAYPWAELDIPDSAREQVMLELGFLGFAW